MLLLRSTTFIIFVDVVIKIIGRDWHLIPRIYWTIWTWPAFRHSALRSRCLYPWKGQICSPESLLHDIGIMGYIHPWTMYLQNLEYVNARYEWPFCRYGNTIAFYFLSIFKLSKACTRFGNCEHMGQKKTILVQFTLSIEDSWLMKLDCSLRRLFLDCFATFGTFHLLLSNWQFFWSSEPKLFHNSRIKSNNLLIQHILLFHYW